MTEPAKPPIEQKPAKQAKTHPWNRKMLPPQKPTTYDWHAPAPRGDRPIFDRGRGRPQVG